MRLVANTDYWDRRRGPRLGEVVFRNDIPSERALELVCTTEGEVDFVTTFELVECEVGAGHWSRRSGPARPPIPAIVPARRAGPETHGV